MPRISGIYKVVSGSDPLLQEGPGYEWFFDFGPAMAQGRQSGTVAVSLRRNPHVQVRLMAWQVMPKQQRLVIGNTDGERSNRAVARADWKVSAIPDGFVLERGNHRLVLKRPLPGEH